MAAPNWSGSAADYRGYILLSPLSQMNKPPGWGGGRLFGAGNQLPIRSGNGRVVGQEHGPNEQDDEANDHPGGTHRRPPSVGGNTGDRMIL